MHRQADTAAAVQLIKSSGTAIIPALCTVANDQINPAALLNHTVTVYPKVQSTTSANV